MGGVGGAGGIMLVKLLGRQRRLESPEAATRDQLVTASIFRSDYKDLNRPESLSLKELNRPEKLPLNSL